MVEASVEQVRAFRLRAHHLDGWRPMADATEVVGLWTTKKKGAKLEATFELWSDEPNRARLQDLAEVHAAGRHLELTRTTFA